MPYYKTYDLLQIVHIIITFLSNNKQHKKYPHRLQQNVTNVTKYRTCVKYYVSYKRLSQFIICSTVI